MGNISVINNTGKEFNVSVNGSEEKIEIVIDFATEKFKLPRGLERGDIFKDKNGKEYVLVEYLSNGDVVVCPKEPLGRKSFGCNNSYIGSIIDEYLCKYYLPYLLDVFGKDNIVAHYVDLSFLDGLEGNVTIKRKVCCFTLDEYRKNAILIKLKIDSSFWLCTATRVVYPVSSIEDSENYVLYVGDTGEIRVECTEYKQPILPKFVLKSTIFE